MRQRLYHTAIVATYLALLLPLTSVAAPLPTAVSPHGTLLRGGAEIFPFGICHTSWIGERYGDERAQDLLAIHDNGLRILQTSLDPTSRESDFGLLDDAARRDMGVMAELYLPALGTLIDRMKSHPAIISWQIGDDFNVTTSKNYCSPELLKERHEMMMKAFMESVGSDTNAPKVLDLWSSSRVGPAGLTWPLLLNCPLCGRSPRRPSLPPIPKV
ncbi:MAG: hypothetical protein RIR25_157 [Verrucomicrobiota bacterium]|jgi:hypothetical protein